MERVKAAAVFSNNMVLQREKNINVWGTGSNGARITVTLAGQRAGAEVIDGKWIAVLPAMPAGAVPRVWTRGRSLWTDV